MIVCPKCGSKNTAPIVYGMPTEELFEESEQNKVIIGGCCIIDCDDDYGCCDCNFQWSKNTLDTKYVKKICIKIWHNGLSADSEIKKHVYDIYTDGRVEYSLHKGDLIEANATKETYVFKEMVNMLHKEIQNILSLNKGMLSLNVRDGMGYSLSVSYMDNRSTEIEGNVVGYPLDVLITEFIDKLEF